MDVVEPERTSLWNSVENQMLWKSFGVAKEQCYFYVTHKK